MTGSDIKITIGSIDKVVQQNYGGGARIAPVAIAEFGIPGLRAAAAPAQINSGCRNDLVAIDGKPLAVRVTGPAAKAGVTNGLTVSACAGPIRLSAGQHEIDTAPGNTAAFSLDRLVLASSAPGSALATQGGHVQAYPNPPAAPRVQVVGQGSTHERVRVTAATGPFMLVLGQSQSKGWQAHVVGGQNLGGSQLVDGYANGWLINPKSSSFEVTMDWTPQRQVWLAIWLTVAFMLLCIGIAAVTWRRRITSAARPGDADVDFSWGGYPHLVGRTRWLAVVASALVAGVMVAPWVGILVGGAAYALTAPWRRFVLVAPAILLAFCGLYMVWQQAAHHFPSVFEWPTLFPLASTPAWIAVAVLTADTVIAIAQRSSSPPPATDG
jgi:hypothetical protein